jgi:ribonuclease P protein component
VIGRKAAVRAVDRNQCKRWVRERFRDTQIQFSGLDVVVRFRAGVGKPATSDVRLEISDVLMAIVRCRDSLSL